MSPSLLMDLEQPIALAREGVGRLDALREATEQMNRSFQREAIKAASEQAGSSQVLDRMWRRFCEMVAEGMLEEVHALRNSFLNVMSEHEKVLKRVYAHAKDADKDSPHADTLLTDIAAVEKLRARLSSRWKDRQSLEELAAQDYPLSASELKAIAAKYPPPQAWYDEDFRPF